MLAMAVLCHRFDLRQGGAALTVQLAWKAFLGRELYQAQADCSQLLLPLASHDKIRSKSYRMVCSTQPEESGNKDYDDHDADEVKNVHCTLRFEACATSVRKHDAPIGDVLRRY
jgi:hypothetical protein